MNREVVLTAAAAFYAGRGYYSMLDQPVSGYEETVDVVSALPVFSELQRRINYGFAPSGILQHIAGADWVEVESITESSGYKFSFVGKILEEAEENGWVELDLSGKPRVRNKEYRVPARACVATLLGDVDLARKLDFLTELEGAFSQVYVVFEYPVDGETMDLIARHGFGVMRFYPRQGAFLELLPAEQLEVEPSRRFAVLVENVLYENMWLRRRDEVL